MKQIKVLMVAGSMNVGGIENQLMHLVRNADKEQFQIDFTSSMPNAFYREEIKELGSKFIVIPEMDWKRPLVYCSKLFRVMKCGHYDIVHSHELFHSGITVFIAFLAGVPCRIVHSHSWSDSNGTGERRTIIRSIYNKVMRCLINDYSTTQIACSMWAGKFLYGNKKVRSKTFHLVYNSVDTRKFLDHYGEPKTGEFSGGDGWKNVLNVARICPVKNQKFLVQLAGVFKQRNDKIRFLCAGSGDEQYTHELQQMIEEKHLESYIILLGMRSDIDFLMKEADAFILPSKYEGMPLAMIEAQTSGLRCISADTYSHEVDFGIGTVQWLKLEDDPLIWVDAIEQAVNANRPEKETIERAIVRGRFDSRLFTKVICNLYKNDIRRHIKSV